MPEGSIVRCANIAVLDNTVFDGRRPVSVRRLSESRIREMARLVALAMGVRF